MMSSETVDTAHEGSVFGSIDPSKFRQVLGQYPTGVAIVTTMDRGGQPLGMTVGSFSSVSLEPPLIAFMASKTSQSWSAIRNSGSEFCVNVLGAHQEQTCRLVATRKEQKFRDIDWRRSPRGNPIVEGCVAFIDCITEAFVDGGDHDIVIARVCDLDVESATYPLLFFRGGYGSFVPLSMAAGGDDLVDLLSLVDQAREQMDELAARFDTEVTAVGLVGRELVLAAASGRVADSVIPTRVGSRLPFRPPFGGVFAAWGDAAVREAWLGQLPARTSFFDEATYSEVPDRIRERGYALVLGHEAGAELERLSLSGRPANVGSGVDLGSVIAKGALAYNPSDLANLAEGEVEFRSASAPVFHANGAIAFALMIWGPSGGVHWETVCDYTDHLLRAAEESSSAIRTGA